MAENMGIQVEVWPVAADDVGVWLISGDDAWRPRLLVSADGEPHAEVELLLAEHGLDNAASILHSTSWRVDGSRVVLTYVAVINPNGFVLDVWPSARPVSLPLAEAVGRPPTNAANEAPAPRYIDVLLHALRHLRFLIDHDATASAEIVEPLRGHLISLEPALAGMYGDRHLG